MRLIECDSTGGFRLTKDLLGDDEIPPYGILSHTWQHGEEVTFNDMEAGNGKSKSGYRKIEFCMQQAKRDGLSYVWVDTCCINKADHVELQDAINSMFSWYRDAAKCYVFLSDVSTKKRKACEDGDGTAWKPAFKASRWFTRGWTLQELLAPRTVEFFSQEGKQLGSRESLEQQIHEVTGINVEALRGNPLREFEIEERFLWAKNRQTTRREDKAYSLLGLFGIFMVPNYGEGDQNAIGRLRRKIAKAVGTELIVDKSKEPSNIKRLRQEDTDLSGDEQFLSADQTRILLDSLRFEQIGVRQAAIRNAHPETCEWLTEHPEYRNWLDSSKLDEHHGLLWIKGKPGAGKSTLMKFALANARETMSSKTVISFFFNGRGEHIERSAIGTYRSLLLQILERLPALQSVFEMLNLSPSDIQSGYKWTAEPLKTLLSGAIQNLGESSVICFVDALDECDEEQIRDMIIFFEHVGELTASVRINFHVCFSSRHYPHISIRKGLQLLLDGQEGHNQDMVNYIGKQLKIGQSQTAQAIRNELQKKASGVFMWMVLVVSILNKEYDRGRVYALQRRLHEIPNDLHQLFRDVLTCNSNGRDELLLCIQWLLFSRRPLSPHDLYVAILSEVETDISQLIDTEVPEDAIERFILDTSKGLVEIVPGTFPRVQLIHGSVKDFLLERDSIGSIWPGLSSNFQGLGHDKLKQICLRYLDPKLWGRRNSFLIYATTYILDHADLAQNGGVSQESFLSSFPGASWVRLNNAIAEALLSFDQQRDLQLNPGKNETKQSTWRAVSTLPTASPATEENDPTIGEQKTHVEYDPKDYHYLSWSALSPVGYINDPDDPSKTNIKAIRGPRPDDRDRGGYHYSSKPRPYYIRAYEDRIFPEDASLLYILVRHNRPNIFRLEFNTLIDPSKEREHQGAPLFAALYTFLDPIVATHPPENWLHALHSHWPYDPISWQIFRYTFQVTGQSNALSYLAGLGNVQKFTVALQKTDCAPAPSEEDTTLPLTYAVRKGFGSIVKLLLQTDGVNIDATDDTGRTAVSYSVIHGHTAISKCLLQEGRADVNVQDVKGRTALSHAVEAGNEEAVSLLLCSDGVQVEVEDEFGRTPLLYAAMSGNAIIFKMLLDTAQVKVDVKDDWGRTPLSWAAATSEAVVRLLLDTNQVEIDVLDLYKRTPLSYASETCADNDGATVRLLLGTKKVDINKKDWDGRTPLSYAAGSGNATTVRLLLDTNDVDMDAQDNMGSTPLSWAATASKASEAVVEVLLKTNNVDVNKKDLFGRTPISYAAEYGNKATVTLLLQRGGVDLTSLDHHERTPLDWARVNGHETVLSLLESHLEPQGQGPTPQKHILWNANWEEFGYATGYKSSRDLRTDMDAPMANEIVRYPRSHSIASPPSQPREKTGEYEGKRFEEDILTNVMSDSEDDFADKEG